MITDYLKKVVRPEADKERQPQPKARTKREKLRSEIRRLEKRLCDLDAEVAKHEKLRRDAQREMGDAAGDVDGGENFASTIAAAEAKVDAELRQIRALKDGRTNVAQRLKKARARLMPVVEGELKAEQEDAEQKARAAYKESMRLEAEAKKMESSVGGHVARAAALRKKRWTNFFDAVGWNDPQSPYSARIPKECNEALGPEPAHPRRRSTRLD